MDINKFTLKDSDIYLYGAAAIGSIIYDDCIKMGLSPIAFIDRRGDEIEDFKGRPVLSMRAVSEKRISEDSVIIISVKNVFEHSEIAAWFLENGYRKLIFRPLASLKGFGNENENAINIIYDRLMEADRLLPEMSIQITEEINHVQYIEKSFIRDADNGRVIAYIPLELVYTDLPKRGIDSRWNDIPILSLTGHIDYFRWLSGDEKVDYKRYIEFCEESAVRGGVIKITEAWRENVLRNRADVFENMNSSLQRDFEFFINNAACASYNDKGYFNLQSGKHRAAFFASKRLRYIPLNIKESEYERWISDSGYERQIEKCKSLHLMSTNAPIEFPYFYDVPCKSSVSYFEILCLLMHEIADISLDRFKEMKFDSFYVVVCLEDEGYISRCLSRYGVTCLNQNSNNVSEIFAIYTEKEHTDSEGKILLLVQDIRLKEDFEFDGNDGLELALIFEGVNDTETRINGLSDIRSMTMMIGGNLRRVRLLGLKNLIGR